MATITIPKELIKNNDLVIISRKEYEKLLYILKTIPKDQWWFWTKEWQAKEREAENDIELKKISGPYKTSQQLKNALGRLKK